jgi:hypothetical protein
MVRAGVEVRVAPASITARLRCTRGSGHVETVKDQTAAARTPDADPIEAMPRMVPAAWTMGDHYRCSPPGDAATWERTRSAPPWHRPAQKPSQPYGAVSANAGRHPAREAPRRRPHRRLAPPSRSSTPRWSTTRIWSRSSPGWESNAAGPVIRTPSRTPHEPHRRPGLLIVLVFALRGHSQDHGARSDARAGRPRRIHHRLPPGDRCAGAGGRHRRGSRPGPARLVTSAEDRTGRLRHADGPAFRLLCAGGSGS